MTRSDVVDVELVLNLDLGRILFFGYGSGFNFFFCGSLFSLSLLALKSFELRIFLHLDQQALLFSSFGFLRSVFDNCLIIFSGVFLAIAFFLTVVLL